jgi:hypothetical protein
MRKRVSRYLFLVAAAIVSLAVAQPALGYTELGTTGTVGSHSLTDTSGSPGAVCVYHYLSGENLWKLRRIAVNPPNVRAVAGQGTEKVAWKFIVQRRFISAFSSTPGPWKKRYASPKFVAYTDSSHDASFTQEHVRVRVPFGPGADAVAEYRVIVKVIWYKASGSVLGKATMRADWYNLYEGLDTYVSHHNCGDYEV